MAVDKCLVENKTWDKKWDELFFSYQQDLRHAYYINALLSYNNSILEIAAGSFRDMAFLNALGYDCYGCDFSLKSVQSAKEYFPHLSKKIFELNAFSLGEIGRYFDVTYHNGFWVLYEDDEILRSLYDIQKSITKKFMIITVHNGHNKDFKNYFLEKQKLDNLYAIRFFEIDEFLNIFNLSRKEVQIYPVGKGKKSHEDLLVNAKNNNKDQMMKFMRPNNFEQLHISERLLFLIPV